MQGYGPQTDAGVAGGLKYIHKTEEVPLEGVPKDCGQYGHQRFIRVHGDGVIRKKERIQGTLGFLWR